MASFSPGTGHQICGPIAHYEPQGVFPSGECVGGLWAFLCAEKRHRREKARSSCPVPTLVLVDERCTYFGLVVGTLTHLYTAIEHALELPLQWELLNLLPIAVPGAWRVL